jgi:hypothetical protein
VLAVALLRGAGLDASAVGWVSATDLRGVMMLKGRSMLFSAVACVALTAGCGDDFSSEGGGSTATGGTGGEAGTGGTGGGTGGGSAGAGGSGGQPVLETIEAFTLAGAPIPEVDVIVSDASGVLLDQAKTDANGQALVDVPEDGSVTIAHSYQESIESSLHTFRVLDMAVGLADGGTFRREYPPRPNPPQQPQPMTVTVSMSSACLIGLPVVDYYVQLGCGESRITDLAAPASFTGYRGCPSESHFDVFVFGRNSAGEVISFSEHSQPFQAGDPLGIQTCPMATTLTDSSVAVTDVPPSSNVEALVFGSKSSQTEAFFGAFLSRVDAPASVSATLRLPQSKFTRFKDYVAITRSANGDPLVRKVAWSRKALSSQPSVSRSFVDFAGVETFPGPDLTVAGRPKLSWVLATVGTVGDVLSLQMEWNPAAAEHTYWRVTMAPVASGDVQLPVLPDELADYRLKAGDVLGDAAALHTDYAELDSVAPIFVEWPDSDDVVAASAVRSL